MVGSSGRPPVPTYLAMAAVVAAVLVGLGALSSSTPQREAATERKTAAGPRPKMAIIGGFGSTIERGVLPKALRHPRVSGRRATDHDRRSDQSVAIATTSNGMTVSPEAPDFRARSASPARSCSRMSCVNE